MHCVTSSTFFILWNGNKMPPFKPSHDLRQGDPLSLYLFIICMEKLSIAINNDVQQGAWEPIYISNNGPWNLTFSLLMMSSSSPSQNILSLDTLMICLIALVKASGLKINLSKSRAYYSACVPQAKINRLTSISGIRSTTSLYKYLSFPILKGGVKRSDFLFIIEKNAN